MRVEAGVAEINNQLCSAMLSLVLSEEGYRDLQQAQVHGC